MALAWAERLNIGRLAAKLARAKQVDVVHLHDPWIAWGYRRACWWHWPARPTRWGFTEHGFGCYADATHEEGLPYTPMLLRWLRGLEARLAGQAHWVLCPTEAGRWQLARDLARPMPLPNWHAVHHARPRLNLPSRAAARQALGLQDDLPVVLAVGRINPVKRLDAVVQACARVPGTLKLILLAAAGDEAPLRALAAGAPQLLFDIRLADDVGPYLAAADVYVSAARNESFGLANLEAMVAGLPMICTAVGGAPEVTGGCAWLVPGGQDDLVAHLASALQVLLQNTPLRLALAEAARQRGGHWLTPDQAAQCYEAIYSGQT